MKKIFQLFALLAVICFAFPTFSSQHAMTFQETKKAARIIWAENRHTLYCECPFDKELKVQLRGCHYQAGPSPRAKRVEWEHIVPVSWFGRQRECWREPICKKNNGKTFKGRDCCELVDSSFRAMYTDLHNLIPVIGEVNQARQAFRFGELAAGDASLIAFAGCDFKIDNKQHVVEPRYQDKGLVARAHLYMADTYGVKLSKNQILMFNRWNRQYPPSTWERYWNDRVAEVQGRDNRFISHYAVSAN